MFLYIGFLSTPRLYWALYNEFHVYMKNICFVFQKTIMESSSDVYILGDGESEQYLIQNDDIGGKKRKK